HVRAGRGRTRPGVRRRVSGLDSPAGRRRVARKARPTGRSAEAVALQHHARATQKAHVQRAAGARPLAGAPRDPRSPPHVAPAARLASPDSSKDPADAIRDALARAAQLEADLLGVYTRWDELESRVR